MKYFEMEVNFWGVVLVWLVEWKVVREVNKGFGFVDYVVEFYVVGEGKDGEIFEYNDVIRKWGCCWFDEVLMGIRGMIKGEFERRDMVKEMEKGNGYVIGGFNLVD